MLSLMKLSSKSWESNKSTGSTLRQYTFTIGKLKCIICKCTRNIIFCILTTWMTIFIVSKGAVIIQFLSLSYFMFPLTRELSTLSFMIKNCLGRHAFNNSWRYFEVLQMAQPHIIFWWYFIGRSWGGSK